MKIAQSSRKRRKDKKVRVIPSLKPFKLVEGFKIIVDTREQQSIFKSCDKELTSRIVSKALKDGDYSIQGFENLFSVERKKISDLYSYCGREFRDKTRFKLKRFQNMIEKGGWVGLIIQATEAQVFNGNFHSQLPPEVVRQQIASFEVKYGIHVYYNQYSKNLCRWVVDRMLKFYYYQSRLVE